jgi:hypothetical protein
MTEVPGAVFIVDVVKGHIAVTSAQAGDSDRRDRRHQLRSDLIDYPIPATTTRCSSLFSADPTPILGRRCNERANQQRARQGRAAGAADHPRVVGRRRPARRGRTRRRSDLPTPEAAAAPDGAGRS